LLQVFYIFDRLRDFTQISGVLMQNNNFTYDIRVFYEDTDAGGIVYYANYLKFFERARTEWLRQLGINQAKFLEQNLGFVVRRVVMENISSAHLDDLITVHSEIALLKRASLVFKQSIVNQDSVLLCTAEVLVACIDHKLTKPCAIPPSMLGAFKRVS
jgi:acyl-CoA thioester hydrolase